MYAFELVGSQVGKLIYSHSKLAWWGFGIVCAYDSEVIRKHGKPGGPLMSGCIALAVLDLKLFKGLLITATGGKAQQKGTWQATLPPPQHLARTAGAVASHTVTGDPCEPNGG